VWAEQKWQNRGQKVKKSRQKFIFGLIFVHTSGVFNSPTITKSGGSPSRSGIKFQGAKVGKSSTKMQFWSDFCAHKSECRAQHGFPKLADKCAKLAVKKFGKQSEIFKFDSVFVH